MIEFAYAGDSTTAMTDSWLYQLTDPNIEPVGGYAMGGKKSSEILAGIGPVSCDVLVIMVGVNDVRLSVPFRGTTTNPGILDNIEAIAAKVGAPKVFLSAIAPCNITDYGTQHVNRKQTGELLNRAFVDLAAEREWMFGDPYNQIRHLDNGYKSGSCEPDNVHPTEASYGLIAQRVQHYLNITVLGAKG